MTENIALCEQCKVNAASAEHTCPFAEEIHGCTDTCTCCSECEYECAMDI